jgi:hypothetical protein
MLTLEGKVTQCHDQFEVIATIQLLFQFLGADHLHLYYLQDR